MSKTPVLTIYNKADKISEDDFVPSLFPNVLISAKTSTGKEKLIEALRRQLMELMVPYRLFVGADEGKRLSELRRQTLVLDEAFIEEKNGYQINGFARAESQWIRRMEK